MQPGPINIAIVAGEASGDRLGAGLIRELKQRIPTAEFSGIGGPKMEAAGCQLLFDMERIGVMGLDGLWEKLRDILSIRKQLSAKWSRNRPAIFIGVDVPDFNIVLESRLKRAGVPCVHYVSPTVWAWRGYRIHKIRRAIHHMLALFPFEADYYRQQKVPVTCVGHPLADEIDQPNPPAARKKLGIDDDLGMLIALLPGSRRSEVKRLAKPLVMAARMLLQQNPDIRFVLPFASPRLQQIFTDHAGTIDDLPLTKLDGQSRLALEAADIAILASGTASLEAALLGTPHVVVYRLSAISHWLMRRLRQVDYFAMPNHLLPEPLVPELIQSAVTPENIVAAVNEYLHNPERVNQIKTGFANIHASLKRDADKLAADAVLGVLLAHAQTPLAAEVVEP